MAGYMAGHVHTTTNLRCFSMLLGRRPLRQERLNSLNILTCSSAGPRASPYRPRLLAELGFRPACALLALVGRKRLALVGDARGCVLTGVASEIAHMTEPVAIILDFRLAFAGSQLATNHLAT